MSTEGITAAMTMTGATDRAVWALCVRQVLMPSVQPGQIVICDTLSVHKNQAIRHLIETAGCQVRFLPPYSPDFSPMALAFSKLKTRVRQTGARTRPAREEAIPAGLDPITAHVAAAWVRPCGSALPVQLL